MSDNTATSIAFSNIAFIKYWGNQDNDMRVPSNDSISMNLDGLYARTTVTEDVFLSSDELTINGRMVSGAALQRASNILDLARVRAGKKHFMRVESENNFPSGAGIASSAAAFAALALAAAHAAGLDLSEAELSRLARRGSGSASRSIPSGFVEWQAGTCDEDSYAFFIAPPEHWALADCVAIISSEHKKTGSTEGHALAWTSPLQAARVADAPRRLEICRRAIMERDFDSFASIVELDSDMMHAVMMTSTPALHYWKPGTLRVMQAARAWRRDGLPACYTVDAGANVHIISPAEHAEEVANRLRKLSEVQQTLVAKVGGGARIVK